MWLACKNRLYTNDRRFRRRLSDDDNCPFCGLSETTSHMLLHCQSIRLVWSALQSIHQDATSCANLAELSLPDNLTTRCYTDVALWSCRCRSPPSKDLMNDWDGFRPL